MVKKIIKTLTLPMTRHPMACLNGRRTPGPQPARKQVRDWKMEGWWWGCRSILISRWSFLCRAALPMLCLRHQPKVLRILRALTGCQSQLMAGAARLGSTLAQTPRWFPASLLFTRTFSSTLLRAAGLHKAKAAPPRQQGEAAT